MSSLPERLPIQCIDCPKITRAELLRRNTIQNLDRLIEVNEEKLAIHGISAGKLLETIDERFELEEWRSDESTYSTIIESIATVAVLKKCEGPDVASGGCGVTAS